MHRAHRELTVRAACQRQAVSFLEFNNPILLLIRPRMFSFTLSLVLPNLVT